MHGCRVRERAGRWWPALFLVRNSNCIFHTEPTESTGTTTAPAKPSAPYRAPDRTDGGSGNPRVQAALRVMEDDAGQRRRASARSAPGRCGSSAAQSGRPAGPRQPLTRGNHRLRSATMMLDCRPDFRREGGPAVARPLLFLLIRSGAITRRTARGAAPAPCPRGWRMRNRAVLGQPALSRRSPSRATAAPSKSRAPVHPILA